MAVQAKTDPYRGTQFLTCQEKNNWRGQIETLHKTQIAGRTSTAAAIWIEDPGNPSPSILGYCGIEPKPKRSPKDRSVVRGRKALSSSSGQSSSGLTRLDEPDSDAPKQSLRIVYLAPTVRETDRQIALGIRGRPGLTPGWSPCA